MRCAGAKLILLLAAVAVTTAGLSPKSAAAAEQFVVIVHPENPTSALDRRFIADVFMKKIRVWPDGLAIRPVDQKAGSSTRETFVQQILNRSISAVKSYWQQMIFSGVRLPPPELDSDDAVIKYVLRNRGAIGYVSARAKITAVKVIPIQ